MNNWVTNKDIALEMLRGAKCQIPGFQKLEETPHFKSLNKIFLYCSGNVKTILDLGCGCAEFGRVYKFFDYTGADLPHVIENAAKKKNPHLKYLIFDAYNSKLEFIKNYDLIIANAFISELSQPDIVLEKVLKNATKYIILHRQKIHKNINQDVSYIKYNGYLGEEYTCSIFSEEFFLSKAKEHSFVVEKALNSGTAQEEYTILLRKDINNE